MACACGHACSSGPRGPYFGDEKFLVLGVRHEEEANAVSKELATDGRVEHLRLRGPTFTALGITERDGRPAWVRAVTQRGIELALDPVVSHPLDRGARYELLAPATPGLYDADGDGFDELVVVRSGYDGGAPCVLAYRVQNAGFIDLVADGARTLAAARGLADDLEPCVGAPAADASVDEPAQEPAREPPREPRADPEPAPAPSAPQ